MKLIETPTPIPFFSKLGPKISKITVGVRNSFVLLDDGDLYVFGDNSEGQSTGYATRYNEPELIPIDLEPNDKKQDIYAGFTHVVVKGTKGNLYTWGSSSDGKLGYSELKQYTSFPAVIHNLKGRKVDLVYAGYNCTIVSTDRS